MEKLWRLRHPHAKNILDVLVRKLDVRDAMALVGSTCSNQFSDEHQEQNIRGLQRPTPASPRGAEVLRLDGAAAHGGFHGGGGASRSPVYRDYHQEVQQYYQGQEPFHGSGDRRNVGPMGVRAAPPSSSSWTRQQGERGPHPTMPHRPQSSCGTRQSARLHKVANENYLSSSSSRSPRQTRAKQLVQTNTFELPDEIQEDGLHQYCRTQLQQHQQNASKVGASLNSGHGVTGEVTGLLKRFQPTSGTMSKQIGIVDELGGSGVFSDTVGGLTDLQQQQQQPRSNQIETYEERQRQIKNSTREDLFQHQDVMENLHDGGFGRKESICKVVEQPPSAEILELQEKFYLRPLQASKEKVVLAGHGQIHQQKKTGTSSSRVKDSDENWRSSDFKNAERDTSTGLVNLARAPGEQNFVLEDSGALWNDISCAPFAKERDREVRIWESKHYQQRGGDERYRDCSSKSQGEEVLDRGVEIQNLRMQTRAHTREFIAVPPTLLSSE
ncbi:unnamed protein product [Amoebophrya sp. A120]|nr:unnamed protein product [Amoebophrya sp. A120]|eukprot:GSA120T00020185001.1